MLRAFVRFRLLLPSVLAVLQNGSPASDRGLWSSADDTVCRYEIHLHGTLSKVRATPSNILFQHDNVLVIDGEGGLRHLAFRDKGGGCHEQTRVLCHAKHGAPSFLAGHAKKVLVQADSPDHCLSMPCHADAGEFALSLSRVMIAASLGPRPEAKHVTIVGLGGGMIPLWFQQQHPSIHVDAVDISSGVVQAVHCFGLTNGTTMNFVNQDGREFLLHQPKQKYDAVLLDAFDDKDNIPACLRTIEFIKMIKTRLVSDGGLVINTWRKNLDVMLPALEQVFDVVLVCKSPGLGNIIVHATSSSLKLPKATSEKPDSSFFGRNFFKPSKSSKQQKDGPAEWLADLEFIHPPKGWVLYPQYHQDPSSGPSAPPPSNSTEKPLLTEYETPKAETDAGNQCHYSSESL